MTTHVVPESILLLFYAGVAFWIYGCLFVGAAQLRHLKLMRWYVPAVLAAKPFPI